jgi:hypothetical protein
LLTSLDVRYCSSLTNSCFDFLQSIPLKLLFDSRRIRACT